MDIPPYNQLNVTTVTLVLSMTNGINTGAAFQFLPVTRINVKQTRGSSKCKLPHCGIPGSILSLRYRNVVRGIIRNKLDPFKNAVTMDISTKRKNINVKLSSYSMQMCGASSKEDGIEAANHILRHLKHIQKMLNKIQYNMAAGLQAIEWVKNATRGNLVERPSWIEKQCENMLLRIYNPLSHHEIIKPNVEIPENLDKEVVNFLLTLAGDFKYHEDLCSKLDFVPNIKAIIDEPLEIDNMDIVMMNYNYSLGFEIDRAKLNQFINGKSGFISRYNNALSTSVTIELPYVPDMVKSIKRQKNKIPHHSFLCYRSGSVTQSGPGGKIMEDAYYMFMNIIAELKPHIQYIPIENPEFTPGKWKKTKPHKMKVIEKIMPIGMENDQIQEAE